MWVSSYDKRTDLFSHLMRRNASRLAQGRPGRYEVGDDTVLNTIREVSRLCPVSLKIFAVQPGLSRAQASPEQLMLLSVTETYLARPHQLDFSVVASP